MFSDAVTGDTAENRQNAPTFRSNFQKFVNLRKLRVPLKLYGPQKGERALGALYSTGHAHDSGLLHHVLDGLQIAQVDCFSLKA